MQNEANPKIGHLARGAGVAVLIWLVAIVLVAAGELLPGNSRALTWIGATHLSDKVLHFSAYTALAFIPVLGFRLRAGLIAAACMILLGVALEFGQTLVPGRSFDIADMTANAAGVFLGAAVALILRRPSSPPSEPPPSATLGS